MENSTVAQGQQTGQVKKTIHLTLTKTIQGQSHLKNPVCQFSYHWDFGKNMGEASLDSIDGVPTNIVLHPLGLKGQLDFMSDMEPTPFNIKGQEVVISRVILDLTLQLVASAAIMYKDGCIQTTENWKNIEVFFAKS